MTDRVPEREQPAHLARMTRLFLDARDRARAAEVIRFAETRLSPAELAGREWTLLRREARARPAPAAPAAEEKDAELEAARAALDAARLVTPTKKGASR
jgi:hypothetical protein